MAATLPVDPNSVPAAQKQQDPSAHSSDYEYCAHFWRMVSDILGGPEEMRKTSYDGNIGGSAIAFKNVPTQRFSSLQATEAQSPYLPRFPNEPSNEYDRRRMNSFLTNIYGDISGNLASKPFSKTCELLKPPSDLEKLSENIDGLGNNMHVFARDIFKTAMDKGITWIMPEYTKVPANSTLEDERNMGARPYWVHINPEKLIAVYSKFLNGKEIIFHARIHEPVVELNGYEEKTVNRVRVLNRDPVVDEATGEIKAFKPATWALLEENVSKDEAGREEKTWSQIDDGNITIGVIPLVPIILGKRDGTSWRVEAPLRDLAYMQIKLFQMESNLDCTKELAAFPMLVGEGVVGTDNENKVVKVPVGPRAVLFTPPTNGGSQGSWKFIEPAGQSLTFLQTDIEKYETKMRDLGYQPLDATNLTVITTANVSAKANNAVQAWALMLKDALEQAWKITLMWLKNKTAEPTVFVYMDFGVDIDAASDMPELQAMEAASIISKKLLFDEAKRRGKLSADADYDKDQEQLATEAANNVLTPEVHIDPVTGMPIAVTPKPGELNPPPPPPKKPVKVKPGEKVVMQ